MDLNYRQLEVLSRAVRYSNLTAASENIGLSQAQLSRIVASLEEQLETELLDRSSKRKPAWRKQAHLISERFLTHHRHLEEDLKALTHEKWPTRLNCSCLEGLVDQVLPGLESFRQKIHLSEIHLSVLDQNQLIESFERLDSDLIFTFKGPGLKKRDYEKIIGFQNLQTKNKTSQERILSDYEYGVLKPKQRLAPFTFVSNSLFARQTWAKVAGGKHTVPDSLMSKASRPDSQAILMLGSERLSRRVWESLCEISFH